ncbi:MAG TPA: amidohydrolase family protein [Pyrinomonadaceae bacterium]|jgi:predicted TIM-barrel fold metal-dependent hydrolase|nr:amidohydrolase family protein [Pyrinomonadaceae bacterium]
MKRIAVTLAFVLALVSVSSAPRRSSAQDEVDRALAEEIFKIRAIDNHAHPLRAVREGEEDREFDALIPDTLEPSPVPARLRPDNPEFVGAWREFWGYRHEDMSGAHAREVTEARRRVMNERGDSYPAWVLDKLNIEVMFANRVAMGRGLTPERFRWVAFDDALILPLSSAAARKVHPDYAAFYPGEDALLRRYLSDLKMAAVPATLGEYTSRVVTPTLESQRRAGAVAVKFEAAYLRPLDFGDASEADAARVYARYARGAGAPTAAEYKPLQDYLFRYVAREAGRLGMAVHIHTGVGVGGYFGVAGSNPALLEPAFNDPTLRKTNFVLIHGGWPFADQAAALLLKPNVYADFSAQTFARSPHALGATLRGWLELAPEKVMFATDAFVLTPEVGWEEVGWLSNRTGREALALALTGMLRDGEITRARASELARMVMRDNAATLYGIK